MGGDKIVSLDVVVAVERERERARGERLYRAGREPYVLMIVVGENGKGTVSHAYMRPLEFQTRSNSRTHDNADIQSDGYSQPKQEHAQISSSLHFVLQTDTLHIHLTPGVR